jgi:alpha-glucosidase (family GH31 glycosyl hydrolase)
VSENRVKKVQRNMGTITGFVAMPPICVLGFHFSKWAPVSADIIMERNHKFTENKFPVDVLWMDIEWA